MKSVVLLCVVIAVGVNGHTVHLSKVQKEKALQYTEACVKETGVKPELIAEAKKGHFSEDESMKKFLLCFFQKAAIVDKDGKLNMESALAKLPPGLDKAETQKILEGCKNKSGKNAAETTFEILKCYRQGAKTQIFLGA